MQMCDQMAPYDEDEDDKFYSKGTTVFGLKPYTQPVISTIPALNQKPESQQQMTPMMLLQPLTTISTSSTSNSEHIYSNVPRPAATAVTKSYVQQQLPTTKSKGAFSGPLLSPPPAQLPAATSSVSNNQKGNVPVTEL